MVHRRALEPDRDDILSRADDLAAWVADALGHEARDAALFRRALTHPSHGGADYQRLEFLGDRVLGLVAAEWLYDLHPDEPEGSLSRRLNALVSGDTCADVARGLGVPARLVLGKQARDDGAQDSDNVLGDAVEALIGALFLEAGLEAARAFIRRAWARLVSGQRQAPKHPKSALQEWAAAHECRPPVYTLAGRSGPQHAPSFRVRVELPGRAEAEAEGSSKQEAETAAARAAGEGRVTERCGLVALVGAPNAGKSTLTNALVRQKVAIVSPKAQTTRTRLMGIAIEGDAQLLLVDTPGIFEPRRRLDRAMVQAAWGGAEDADLIALVVDAKAGLGPKVQGIVDSLAGRPEPKIVVLNKVDVAAKERLLALAAELDTKLSPAAVFMVSATTGDGIEALRQDLAARMPEGPWHFPEDQVSDATDRMLAAEITREQLYLQLHAELPHASAVETEKYEERRDGSVAIHQQILVARPTQRAIVLGERGARIKQIGARARAQLSELLGRKVHLFLHVKVKEDWEEDRGLYREIGLDWVE